MLYVNIASPLARAVLCTADELGIDYETTVRISSIKASSDSFDSIWKVPKRIKIAPSLRSFHYDAIK